MEAVARRRDWTALADPAQATRHLLEAAEWFSSHVHASSPQHTTLTIADQFLFDLLGNESSGRINCISILPTSIIIEIHIVYWN